MTADPIQERLDRDERSARPRTVPAFRALRAVLDLHRPTTLQATAAGCNDEWTEGDCGHDECPLVDVTVCRHCEGIAATVDEERSLVTGTEHPCPTVRAISEALGVTTDG